MDVGVELSSAGDQHRHSTVSAISGTEQMHKSNRLTDAAPSVGQTNPAYDHTEQLEPSIKSFDSRNEFSIDIKKPDQTENQDGGQKGGERDIWDRPLEFILSCVAMSVGLGNFWRFPTTAYENGGGAFLLPYMVVLFLIGRPMYFLEMSLGQFTSRSTAKVWCIVPALKGVGYAMALSAFMVVTYYAVIIAISVFYLAMSFQSVLPWSKCGVDWANAATCIEVNSNSNSTIKLSRGLEVSALQYFERYLFQVPENLDNGPGLPNWKLLICLIISWIAIAGSLIKGVKSHGKLSYITAIFPYVGLFTLLIKGVLLPGATEGMLYFITPRWDELLSVKIWYAAVTQMFFSLSVGFGCITMFSSHNNFRSNIYKYATIISIMDTCTSVLAGLTIFSVLGYLKHITKADNFSEIVSGGTTLVFVTYPTAIASFETVPQLFSVLFFLVLITLGLGSATALVSVSINIIQDKFVGKVRPSMVTLGVCFCGFLLGLPYICPGGQWILDLTDFFGGGFVIYILSTLEAIGIFWIYGYRNYFRDLRFMIGFKLGVYWKFCLIFFIPVGLIGIFTYFAITFQLPTYNNGLQYPLVAKVFGFLIFGVAMSMVVVQAVIAFVGTNSDKPFFQRLRIAFSASESYSPRLPDDKEAWGMFCRKDSKGRNGEDRLDRWKKFSKKALEDPAQLATFNRLYSDNNM